MLDRNVVSEFLESELKEMVLEKPKTISEKSLVETFCRYVEDDYYEWLKDNFKSFFNYGNPEWDWIKDRIEHYKSS